jgi:hypothetical protein
MDKRYLAGPFLPKHLLEIAAAEDEAQREADFLKRFGVPMPSGDVDEWIRARREAEAKRVGEVRSVSDEIPPPI